MKNFLLTLLCMFAVFSVNALTYNVTVPTGTNACYIAGDMNGWSHQQMTKVDDTHYTIEIANANTDQKYKYCSGPGWGYVEKAGDGSEMDNRSYSENDIVSRWVAVFDKTLKNINLTYNVTVPKETKCCYILGGWDGWKSFKEMKKIDDTHYTVTVNSNHLFKYNYFAGRGWGYIELTADKKAAHENRTYSKDDVVYSWDATYDKSVPDAVLTYKVTVPEGTNSCYIVGGWDNWSSFKKMEKIDPLHFSITFMSNKALKYMYLSGPGWEYREGSDQTQPLVRTYSSNDFVLSWTSVCNPK